jgi:hypothetical protein
MQTNDTYSCLNINFICTVSETFTINELLTIVENPCDSNRLMNFTYIISKKSNFRDR